MEGFVENLELFLFHFNQRTDKVLSAMLVREGGNCMVEVIAERRIDVGGKGGLVDAFLLVDDGGRFFVFDASVSSLPALLVGLPLLLLRVANAH